MKKRTLKIVTCCMAGTLLAATPVYAAPAAANAARMENGFDASVPSAGVFLEVSNYLTKPSAAQKDSVVTDDDEKKAAGTKNANAKKKNTASKTNKKKASKYDNMAVSQVDDYVNIRKRPNEDSKVLGKLYSDSVAEVLKKKGSWYKIRSGSVTGYVKGKYIAVGDKELIQSVGVQSATVTTTTLNVRSKASEKSDVLALVPDGEKLAVSSMKKYKDGWVKVKVDGTHGYVSSDYVKVTTEYTYAESRAEEKARLEEARRAEQEAAAAGAVSQADTDSSQASQNGTGSSSDSSSAENQASADSSTSSADSSTSSAGQAVVNYASQFVGNPYVWGGTSLTNGADCSGFVMSVYAHFGVSLPHSSDALAGVGYGVSYDSMQPGDIICYSGHVAIYAGNNTVVHASSAATGIKYTSPANYRSIVAVRRIF